MWRFLIDNRALLLLVVVCRRLYHMIRLLSEIQIPNDNYIVTFYYLLVVIEIVMTQTAIIQIT